jgi:hypothetical protein
MMIRNSTQLVDSRRHKKARRGSLLLETTVAIVILAVAIVAVAHTMAVLSVQRQSAERQTLAMQEAANLMERIYVLPVDEITTEKVATLKLPAACRQRLPGAKLGVAVESLDQDPPAKRISIEIEWTGHGGVRSRPIRVTAWKHAKKEAAE